MLILANSPNALPLQPIASISNLPPPLQDQLLTAFDYTVASTTDALRKYRREYDLEKLYSALITEEDGRGVLSIPASEAMEKVFSGYLKPGLADLFLAGGLSADLSKAISKAVDGSKWTNLTDILIKYKQDVAGMRYLFAMTILLGLSK